MNLIQWISPNHPPTQIKAQGELAVIRERILQSLLVFLLTASFIGLVSVGIITVPRQQYGLIYLFSGLFALIFACTVFRNISYTIRSLLIILAVLGLTIFSFAAEGLEGNGKIYLLVYLALTTVLLGRKAGFIALIFSLLAFVVSGYFIYRDLIVLPETINNLANDSLAEWVRTGAYISVVASVITFSLGMLIHGLEDSFHHADNLSRHFSAEQASLQARIEQRTNQLKLRMQQVLTASEVSQIIVSQHDPGQLLLSIVDLLQSRFNLYYAGVFIVDDFNNAVLRAGSGEAGKKMVASGHYLPLDEASMIGWAISNNRTRIALDVGAETIRFNNPYLPDTRSELAIPIIQQNVSIGAITIQSTQVNAFDEEDIFIFEGIANALAVALENTKLYTQAQEALDEVRSLNRGYLLRAWSELANEKNRFRYSYENDRADPQSEGRLVEIPLSVRDQVIGSLKLEIEGSTLDPDQQDFIDVISTQTALALENARLIEETQRRSTQEQFLNDLTSDFSQATNIEEILKSALRHLNEIPTVSEASIQLVPPRNNDYKNMNDNGHEGQLNPEKIV